MCKFAAILIRLVHIVCCFQLKQLFRFGTVSFGRLNFENDRLEVNSTALKSFEYSVGKLLKTINSKYLPGTFDEELLDGRKTKRTVYVSE